MDGGGREREWKGSKRVRERENVIGRADRGRGIDVIGRRERVRGKDLIGRGESEVLRGEDDRMRIRKTRDPCKG